jgi:hypothetical protein
MGGSSSLCTSSRKLGAFSGDVTPGLQELGVLARHLWLGRGGVEVGQTQRLTAGATHLSTVRVSS